MTTDPGNARLIVIRTQARRINRLLARLARANDLRRAAELREAALIERLAVIDAERQKEAV